MKSEKPFSSGLSQHWLYFTVAMVLTIVPYIIYGVNMVKWRNSPDFGWRTMYDSGPNFVAEIFKRGEKAGLRVGDIIQAINGKTYNTFDELYFEVRHNEPDSINTYTVTRNGQIFEISITTGRLGLKAVLKRSGSIFLIGVVYFVIGVLVFLMKPRAAESWLFLVMTCFLSMEITFGAPSDLIRPLWFYDIRLLENCLLPASMIHLALRFPKTHSFLANRPWLWIVPYLTSLVLFVLIEVTSTAYWNVPQILDLLNYFYLLLGVLVFLISMIWNFLKDSSFLIKVQSQAIFIGMLLGILIPVADMIVRVIWGVYLFPDPSIGFAVFLTLFPLSIGYTIVKYDLFAIDALIKRTYGYVLTTGAVAGTYGLFVLISNLAFGSYSVYRSPIFPIVFVLTVIFLFNPVRNRFQNFVDRVFYRLEYDYQETVQKISESMRTLLDLDEIGRNIMDTALGTMFIDSGCVMLLNPNKQAYECLTVAGNKEVRRNRTEPKNTSPNAKMSIKNELAHPYPTTEDIETKYDDPNKSRLQGLKLASDDPFIRKIENRKKEVTIYDIQADPYYENERERCEKAFEQMQATLVLPLIYEDRLTGLISLGDKKSGKFYRREDINLLKTLANQGAVAIENALLLEEVVEKERMEEELAIAHDLQTSMLPATCPKIEGFEMAAVSIPAREVGGDFFDFIEMGNARLGLVIGDVTGKSVSGALVMSASRSVFRMLSEENLSVSEIMIKANRRTKNDIKSGMFVALLYAELNSEDKTLSMCSAGQTQPIYFSKENDTANLLETKGDTFPLGILPDVEYQETRIQLESEDKVVFYTDGIVEAMNEQGDIFGFDRLMEIVNTARSMTCEALLNQIINQVNTFAGSTPQHDDLTVIVVSVA